MYSTRPFQPLSPPTSPRMSGSDQKPFDNIWNAQHSQHMDSLQLDDRSREPNSTPFTSFSLGLRGQSHTGVSSHTLPTFADVYGSLGNPSPATTASQSHLGSGSDIDFPLMKSEPVPEPLAALKHRDSVLGQPLETSCTANQSSDAGCIEDQEEEEGLGSDGDDLKAENESQLTPEEIRRNKRKMKRFRLTHSQTRYLLSEFARQAHPDAGHREKLSKEIPGLSPRQVQVWFQNRRAKLKRMTDDDRDRTIKTRAMPESYDLNQQLHHPYGQSSVTIASSHGPGMSRPGDMRTLSLDTLRRPSEGAYSSPTSMTSGMGPLSYTPPQSATEVRSPTSTGPDLGPYGFRSMMDTSRRPMYPQHSASSPYASSFAPSFGRIPSFDRFQQPTSDPLGSPLRASISHPGSQASSTPPHQLDRRSSTSQVNSSAGLLGLGRSPFQRDMPPPTGPNGSGALGFSFTSTPSFQTTQPLPTTSTGQLPLYRGPGSPTSHNQTAPYSSYFDYNNQPYSGQQQHSPYGSSYGSGYSTPMANQVAAFPAMPGHSQPYAQTTSDGALKE